MQIPGWDLRFRISIQLPGGLVAATAGHGGVMALCLWEKKTSTALSRSPGRRAVLKYLLPLCVMWRHLFSWSLPWFLEIVVQAPWGKSLWGMDGALGIVNKAAEFH